MDCGAAIGVYNELPLLQLATTTIPSKISLENSFNKLNGSSVCQEESTVEGPLINIVQPPLSLHKHEIVGTLGNLGDGSSLSQELSRKGKVELCSTPLTEPGMGTSCLIFHAVTVRAASNFLVPVKGPCRHR
uniref:Uncharacterized protein n=1 Tax=Megaselia scalaris TaxID=36166 RepID=T1H1L0_MEGSC